MRFSLPDPRPRGDLRQKSRFLILPKDIMGDIRWLEVATWWECYEKPPEATAGSQREVYEAQMGGVEPDTWLPYAWDIPPDGGTNLTQHNIAWAEWQRGEGFWERACWWLCKRFAYLIYFLGGFVVVYGLVQVGLRIAGG